MKAKAGCDGDDIRVAGFMAVEYRLHEGGATR
jgi:hypothetical protein